MKKKNTYLKCALIIIYLTLICIFLFHIKEFSVERLLSYSPKNKLLASLFVLLLFSLKSLSVVFPIVVLHILSGFLFSPVLALIINCIGTALCYTIPYLLGRFSGAAAVEARVKKNKKLSQLFEKQHSHKFFLPFFLRVISCLPCDLISLYMGALKIPFHYYVTASMLGTLPGLIPATFIGKNITDPTSSEFIISFTLTVVCSVSSVLIFIVYNKRQRK